MTAACNRNGPLAKLDLFSHSHAGAPMRMIQEYLDFYQKFLMESWHNMTPTRYGFLLVTIAVVGWLMMKSGRR